LIKSNGNALLADEMGLGKTVQTLAYIATERTRFPSSSVAPLVTLKNWEREIEKFRKKRSKNGRLGRLGVARVKAHTPGQAQKARKERLLHNQL